MSRHRQRQERNQSVAERLAQALGSDDTGRQLAAYLDLRSPGGSSSGSGSEAGGGEPMVVAHENFVAGKAPPTRQQRRPKQQKRGGAAPALPEKKAEPQPAGRGGGETDEDDEPDAAAAPGKALPRPSLRMAAKRAANSPEEEAGSRSGSGGGAKRGGGETSEDDEPEAAAASGKARQRPSKRKAAKRAGKKPEPPPAAPASTPPGVISYDSDAFAAELRAAADAAQARRAPKRAAAAAAAPGDAPPAPPRAAAPGAASASQALRALFTVAPKRLDAEDELRRMFGRLPADGEAEPAGAHRRGGDAAMFKRSLLTAFNPRWPPVATTGFDIVEAGEPAAAGRADLLRIRSVTGVTPRVFEAVERGEFSKVSKSVRSAQASDDVGRLQDLAMKHPGHLRAGYIFAVMIHVQDRKDEAAQTFKRLAHCLCLLARGSFNFTSTYFERVLPFVPLQSDVIFLVLQQLMHIHTRSGTLTAALELSKLIYNLDPTDPTGILFNLEYLCIRSSNPTWLLDVTTAWRTLGLDPCVLPIGFFGRALACVKSEKMGQEETDACFDAALATWPEIVPLLLANADEAAVWGSMPDPLARFAQGGAPEGYAYQVVSCYVARMKELWTDPRAQSALKAAVERSKAVDASVFELRRAERDLLLSTTAMLRSPVGLPSVNGVLGVVDEVMAGIDHDRAHLRRMWSAEHASLPPPVQEQLLDLIADRDFSPLAAEHPVWLFFKTLLPWNSVTAMLSRKVLAAWRHENPTDAAEWEEMRKLEERFGRAIN
ncbi:putative transcription factor 25-like [Diplonema papillatum]|nr:putative transcription factor 25-like [Diplonema papillatum]